MKRFLSYSIFFICLFNFSAHANTYYVTSYGDSGPGTLRQAILDINSQPPGPPHTIQFITGGAGTISLFSPLPAFTSQFFVTSSYQITINGNGMNGPVFKGPISTFSFQLFTPLNFSSTIYYVTTTSLSGSGSFSEAISYCEQTPAKDFIYFNITGQPPHVVIGSYNSTLSIIESIVIDGSTQPANGYTGAMPKITIDNPIYLNGQNSELHGISLYKHLTIDAGSRSGSSSAYAKADNCIIGKSGASNVFAGGIDIYDSKNTTIQSNYFGMDMNSNPITVNSDIAIDLSNTENLNIINNIISNHSYEIYCSGDTITSIKGNKIGTNAAGTSTIGSNSVGIYLSGSKNIRIGGASSSDRNIISGHTNAEIYITSARILNVKGNYIGTDATGTVSLTAPSSIGIKIAYGDSLIIGGYSPAGEGNSLASPNPMRINQATKTHVWGNRFNISASETPLLTGNDNGIYIDIQSDVEIGKITTGYGNRFDGFLHYGVRCLENQFTSPQFQSKVTIRGNSFTNNAWGGIGGNGIVPIITQVSTNQIQGTAAPLAVVDLYYHNGTGPMQGKTYFATVNTNTSGKWSYSGTLNNPCSITAAATLSKSTSSFSQAYWFNGASEDILLCKNSAPVKLHATGGASYTWSPATYLDDPQSSDPTFEPGETQSYIVSITNNQNCTGYDTLKVTVKTQPDAPGVSTPVAYCKNAEANVLAATGDELKWYTEMNGIASSVAPTPSTESTGTTIYYVTQTSNGCTSAYSSIEVDVSQPDAPIVNTPVSYCKNAEAIALSATGDELKWYTEMNGTASSVAPTPSTESTGTTIYYVTQTSDGCTSPYSTIEVDVTACTTTANQTSSTDAAVLIYPQPFTNTTRIHLKDGQTLQTVYVFNSSGTLTNKLEQIHTNEIEIGENLENGIYLLLIETSQGSYKTKINKASF